MVDNDDWGPEGLDDLEQELESLSSVGPDNATEDLSGLENEKDLEEYGVWVKVGPETLHDSPDIDLEGTEEPELENLEDNGADDLMSDNEASEPLSNLEDEPTVSLDDWESETTNSQEAETRERTTEPLDELEESLSETIDWDKKSELEEDDLSASLDASDAHEPNINELDNLDEGFDEIELGDLSAEDEFGTASAQTNKPVSRSAREDSFEPPEIISSGMQDGGKKSAAVAVTANKGDGELGTTILEQIERELTAD